MAVNWAMISRDGRTPVPLPDEQIFLTQEKVAFSAVCGGGYPGHGGASYKGDGIIYLTNQRVIFVTVPEQKEFKSMTIPIRHLTDGHFVQPWFGANSYQGVVLPVHGGGLPMPAELKIQFKEGGGFEFSTMFSELLHRMSEIESSAPLDHIEQLPTYPGQGQTTSLANAEPVASSTQPTTTNATTAPTLPAIIPSASPARIASPASIPTPPHVRSSSLVRSSSIPHSSPITTESEGLIAEALNSHISLSSDREAANASPPVSTNTAQGEEDLPSDLPPSYDEIVGSRS